MMLYMYMFNWLISLTFMFMNHPLSLGCILLIQTIMISMLTGLMFKNFWFSYILFLIMISGMLVMFIYMTSIASNEKFKMPKKMIIFYMLMLLLLLMFINIDNFYTNFTLISQPSCKMINFSLNKFFNLPNTKLMLMMIFYLFVTLIAIVKITSKYKGPLRQK